MKDTNIDIVVAFKSHDWYTKKCNQVKEIKKKVEKIEEITILNGELSDKRGQRHW